VFGKNLTKEIIDNFVSMLPSKFKLVEISLNSGNIVGDPKSFSLLRSNYILHLNKSYEQLYKGYRDNHKRNINKAFQLGCSISKEIPVDEIIQLNKAQLQHVDGTKPGDYPNFKKLNEFLRKREQAKTYAIVDPQNNILASAVFFFSHNRAYYIMVGNHLDGKTIGASHALIDAFIKDHAGQNLILDFEGSDIPNLAFFYSGFGAKEEIYPALKINRLPFYVKWLK
jgi:hypothetical protein